ncbi:MAG: hypothetical protein EXQ87_13275 [Alphaproteobacteria bacterium]|nr:hypothetical protein [Alphaproteobacteria bacterium]
MAPAPKTLYLLRHGEAEPAAAGGDRARRLTLAGEAAAHRLGRFMMAEAMRVDYGLASEALRARATLHAVMAEWPAAPMTVIDPALYNADPAGLMARIQGVGAARSLLVIGHNPAIGELARSLAATGEPSLAQRLDAGLPPLGLAVFDVHVPAWHEFSPARARLSRVVMPDDC